MTYTVSTMRSEALLQCEIIWEVFMEVLIWDCKDGGFQMVREAGESNWLVNKYLLHAHSWSGTVRGAKHTKENKKSLMEFII